MPVDVQGPDGKTYSFPEGTDKAAAIAYFKKKGIGVSAPPEAPSTAKRVAQEWGLGLAGGVGMPETQTPWQSFAEGARELAKPSVFGPAALVYRTAKGLIGQQVDVAKDIYQGIKQKDLPRVAHGIGTETGVMGMGALTAAGPKAAKVPLSESTVANLPKAASELVPAFQRIAANEQLLATKHADLPVTASKSLPAAEGLVKRLTLTDIRSVPKPVMNFIAKVSGGEGLLGQLKDSIAKGQGAKSYLRASGEVRQGIDNIIADMAKKGEIEPEMLGQKAGSLDYPTARKFHTDINELAFKEGTSRTMQGMLKHLGKMLSEDIHSTMAGTGDYGLFKKTLAENRRAMKLLKVSKEAGLVGGGILGYELMPQFGIGGGVAGAILGRMLGSEIGPAVMRQILERNVSGLPVVPPM